MSRNYGHSPNAEAIANRVRLFLFISVIVMFAILAVSTHKGQGEQLEEQNYVQVLEKGEYEAALTVSTENGRITIPVTFVVENDGELGTVNFNTNEKVENE